MSGYGIAAASAWKLLPFHSGILLKPAKINANR